MDLRALKDRASNLFGRRKFAKSLSAYEALIRASPGDARAWLRHADACQRMGARDKAIGSYRRAAAVFDEKGQWSQARAALKLALALCPSDPVLIAAVRELDARKAIPPPGQA